MATEETQHKHLEGRVSVVETELKNLSLQVRDGFDAQTRTFKAMWEEIKGLNADRKPNYLLWAATASLMFALAGGLYTLIGLQIQAVATPINMQLREIETQFDADAQLRNVQFSDQQRKNWQIESALHQLGATYPEPAPGPYYQPNIARKPIE